jgi:hypothetical protein
MNALGSKLHDMGHAVENLTQDGGDEPNRMA